MSASILWLIKTSLHLRFRPQNCINALPRYDFQAGFLPFWAQLSWRPSLNRVLLRHLQDLLFREADIQSHLSGAWLALQGSWRNKSPNVAWILTKPATVDWLWPPCWDTLMRPWSWMTVSSFLQGKCGTPSLCLYLKSPKIVDNCIPLLG